MATGSGVVKKISEDRSEIQFQLSGLATYEQMQKLLVKFKADKAAVDEEAKTRKEENEARKEATEDLEDFGDRIDKVNDSIDFFKGGLGSIPNDLKKSFSSFDVKMLAAGSSLLGWVMGLGDDVQKGLQLGISGGVLDFAISAKTAGVGLNEFNSALKTTGGGFAALGGNATDGAKQFGALVGNVRYATAAVGNLGMSNEQLADFTAQQVKIAVQQGYKGKAAAKLVEDNSRDLSNTISDLASATGKSTLEIAASVSKLATDPLVSAFVSSAKRNGAAISSAVQIFAANLKGVLGEAGEILAADALKSAIAGLPLAMTKSGQSMLIASSAMYNELDKQAKEAARGGGKSAEEQEANRKRLRDLAIAEYEARSNEINTMAMLEGPAGDAARQLLELKKEAETYNDVDKVAERQRQKTAAEFNSNLNQFKANLQALAVPFLNILNNIDWAMFIGVFNGVAKAVEILLMPLTALSKLIGALGPVGEGLGILAGAALALGVIFTKIKVGLGTLIEVLLNFGKARLGPSAGKILPGIGDAAGEARDRITGGRTAPASTTGRKTSPGSGIGKGIENIGKGIGKGVGGLIEGLLKGVGKGLEALGGLKALAGAASLVVISGSMFIAAKSFELFAKISWEDMAKGFVTLLGLGAVGATLGFALPFILPGAVAIGALGLALIPFAAAANLASPAIEAITQGFVALSQISATNLIGIGAGLAAIGAGMAAFSAGALVSSITGLASGLLSLIGPKSPLEHIKELAPYADQISKLGVGVKDFGLGLQQISTSLTNLDEEKLATIKEQLIDLAKIASSDEMQKATQAFGLLGGKDSAVARPTTEVSYGAASDLESAGVAVADKVTIQDQFKMFAQEQKKASTLLETAVELLSHQTGIQAQTAGSAADSARYTRQQAMQGG